MKKELKNNSLQILLNTRIDSNTVNAVEEEIEGCIKEANPENMILDARDLNYISSAGLRLLLKLQKRFPGMKVIHVSKDVQEIFEMTGFDQILLIEKARRKVSVEGKDQIGAGAYGAIYRLDPETIVKVYHHGSLEMIEEQTEIARKAFLKGIPSAICYDIVDVNGHYGAVYELIRSDTLAKVLTKHPEQTDLYAQKIYELLKTMARTDISDFISTKANDYYIHVYQRLRDHFSDEQWKSLVELIETIPERDTMLHSDVHAKNVMVQDGELLLIDMDEIMLGHPIYDLADIYFMYAFVSKRPHGKYATGMELELCEDFNEKILVYCLKDLSEKEREKVIKALELIGRLRLNSGLILYLDQIDENEAKNRIPGIIEDVVDNLLPCQKELENGLALFPEWNDAS